MFDTILENIKNIVKSRMFPVVIIYAVLFIVIVNRLFYLQIVMGNTYDKEMQTKMEAELDLNGTRGNIYDRNGKLIAGNELSYSVTLKDTGDLKDNKEKNAMIYSLIRLIEDNNGTLAVEFPLSLNEDGQIEFNVDEPAQLRFKRDIFYHSKVEELKDYERQMTAEQTFDYLRYGTRKSKNSSKMFDIGPEYSIEDALKVMSVRYALFINTYYKYRPITIAMNVNNKTVAAVKENSSELPGADILQETRRVYYDSFSMAPILGYTGLITNEALDEFEKNGTKDSYTLTDQIGKAGVEKEFENYLHGKAGKETVITDESHRVLEVKERIEPVTGNDVYLTIDSELQKACYQLLERKIASILIAKINNSKDVGSKGISASNIRIPIYDVYFALIDNNVIDIHNLDKDDATSLERKVGKKFKAQQKSTLEKLKSLLSLNSRISNKDAGEEMQEYLDYIYKILISKKSKYQILYDDKVDSKDEKYIAYTNQKISLSEFLQYAISQNWVNLDKLGIGANFYSAEELYGKLLDYIWKSLKNDSGFDKKIYRSMIYSNKLPGSEICLLLFDQGVLKYNEEEIDKLKSGSISAYTFLLSKIKNLKIKPSQLALDPCSGSVVITDVNTGDVLALVTYPSYDNNKLANKVDSSYMNKLVNDKSSPMYSRAMQTKTAPGSTYKIITEITGLEEGVVAPYEKIKDLVRFEKIIPSPTCLSNHGMVDAAKGLEVSCNYFSYEIAYRLGMQGSADKYNSDQGLKKLEKYANMFGLDEVSGIELPESEPQISGEDAIRSAIGQGTNNFTPSQLARYITAVANKGTSYKLTILDKITDNTGRIVKNNKAEVHNKVKLKDSTWDVIHDGMYRVINGSQGSIRQIYSSISDELKVAGKTGTAEQNDYHPDHGLFISYAPYDKPEISVTTTIPNGYTSHNPAELAKEIYQYYFKLDGYKDLFKSELRASTNVSSID